MSSRIDKKAPLRPSILFSEYESKVKDTVIRTDMNDEMQRDAIVLAKKAICEQKIEKDIAANIKHDMDANFPGTTWQCIVGNNFSVSVGYATRCLIYMTLNQYNILLFKSPEE
eukprot:TRINITY_DN5472_c0_g1_i1.p1 TRINITY_DN5472_c0_g1~~TRINITY_DN5472_c0_g1_i1.p1  ORF type:complete len:122 (-),score=18.72 TRINITY_DN5472_c0_g1_i1:482-820(-)